MSDDIKKMFSDAVEKAVTEKEEISENSILHRILATNVDPVSYTHLTLPTIYSV